MNVTKCVTIPNDVADAIEHYRKHGFGNAKITEFTLNKGLDGSFPNSLRSIPFDTLMAALVNGYEREQTAEQRAHAEIKREYLDISNEWDFARGVKFTLDTLGIKIEGVNA